MNICNTKIPIKHTYYKYIALFIGLLRLVRFFAHRSVKQLSQQNYA